MSTIVDIRRLKVENFRFLKTIYLHLLVCYLNNTGIFMLGEALDPAVPVFEGQRTGTAHTVGVAVAGNVM